MDEDRSKVLKIQKIVKYLQGNECILKSQRIRSDLSQFVKTLRLLACEVGLSQEDIFTVADLASSGKFGEVICNSLIRSLIPRESVPQDAVLLLVSRIGQNHISIKLKQLILRWVVLVFDIIAQKNSIHAIYGIIFHYIDSEVLCPIVCQLLSLLTRKYDVLHFRIRKLLSLQSKIGGQPYLCGLLSVYRMYQPSLISMAGRHNVFFKNYDKSWSLSISGVQHRYGLHMLNETMSYNASHLPQTNKHTPLITPPTPTMCHDDQPLTQVMSGKIPFYRIKSFAELLNNFNNLELTCQAHSLLSSTTLQHLLAITHDRTIPARLSFWLHHRLCEELVTVAGETARGLELIKCVVEFSGFIQECLPVCEAFIFRYLYTWDGQSYRPYILKLITRLRLLPTSVLKDFVFAPLRKLFNLSSDVFFKCSVISILQELLSNYLNLESDRYDVIMSMQDDNAAMDKLASYMFQPINVGKINPNETIFQLIKFVDFISLEGLIETKCNVVLMHSVLQFYVKTSRIYSDHERELFTLPPSPIVSLALFSLSPMFVSTMFGILLNHTQALNKLGKSHHREHYHYMLELNSYLTDVHDTFWRWNAFHPHCHEDSSIYKHIHVDNIGHILTYPDVITARRMFTIERHPALTLHATKYLQLLNRDPEDMFKSELVTEPPFIEYLETKGLTKLTTLIKFLRRGIPESKTA
ncbi:centromere protein I-like isoform X1 [Ciona intestinalis]